MSQENLPLNLNDLSYEDMFRIARDLVEKEKFGVAAHVVYRMAQRWPERVLNSQEKRERRKGGDTNVPS